MEEHPLRAYRRETGKTLETIAGEADTTKETISRIETGVRAPSLNLASRLSQATGIPIDKFVKQGEAAQ